MPYVNVTRETAGFMEEYAKRTGLSLEAATNAALKEWFEIMGSAVIVYTPSAQATKNTSHVPARKSRSTRSRMKTILSFPSDSAPPQPSV